MKKIQIGIDEMDNSIQNFLHIITQKELKWNIEPIALIRDAVEEGLRIHKIELEYIDDSICGGLNDENNEEVE